MRARPLPWSATCFVCGDSNPRGLGLRFHVDGDLVRADTTVDVGMEGFPGHVHGGIITALLDETAGWACSVAAGTLFYTVELTVRFKRPVPGGQPISVWGRFTQREQRLARASSWIEDQHRQTLATADGLFFPLPPDRHREILPHLKMPGRAACQDDIGGPSKPGSTLSR